MRLWSQLESSFGMVYGETWSMNWTTELIPLEARRIVLCVSILINH